MLLNLFNSLVQRRLTRRQPVLSFNGRDYLFPNRYQAIVPREIGFRCETHRSLQQRKPGLQFHTWIANKKVLYRDRNNGEVGLFPQFHKITQSPETNLRHTGMEWKRYVVIEIGLTLGEESDFPVFLSQQMASRANRVPI